MDPSAPPREPAPRSLPRALAVAAVGLLVVAALLLVGDGGAQRAQRLAAMDAHPLVDRDGDRDGPLTLAERILTGPDVETPGPATLRLRLGQVRFLAVAGDEVPGASHLARAALIRGLRSAGDRGLREAAGPDDLPGEPVSVQIDGEREPVAGGTRIDVQRTASGLRLIWSPDSGPPVTESAPWQPPNRASLLPPLIAIVLAIATRRPLLSLLVGVIAGACLVASAGGAAPLAAVASGVRSTFDHYLWDQIKDSERVQIVTFVVLMLAMVGNLTRNGGIRGVMDRLRRLAKGPRSTQGATVGMGFAIFFDDYANTVLVGSTMRPLTDRFRISREKLAYLVDSTAAPVAGLSLFSTWIAFEVSTFSPQLPVAGLSVSDGYQVFLQTLPYRFYCILTLVMVVLVAWSGRDFGPMRKAEARARTTGQLVRSGGRALVGARVTALEMAEGIQPRAWRAIVPLLAFIGVTLFTIALRGEAFDLSLSELFTLQGVTGVLYNGSGNIPLMVGSMAGFGLAGIASHKAGLSIGEILRAAWATLSSMGIALGILYSAWMVGAVCADLGTASFLSVAISDNLNPALLPAVLILLSAFVAFSTGSSWGTMSILLPLVVGLAYQLGQGTAIGGYALMILSIGAVLEGAIFGDHCSPISDTTVLSSISCAADHIDHVRTQAPYALVVMTLAIFTGYLPAAFLGLSPLVCWAMALTGLVLVVFGLGRRTPAVIPDGGDEFAS